MRLLQREEADAGPEEARKAAVVVWGRYWARKLENAKENLTLPATHLGATITVLLTSIGTWPVTDACSVH